MTGEKVQFATHTRTLNAWRSEVRTQYPEDYIHRRRNEVENRDSYDPSIPRERQTDADHQKPWMKAKSLGETTNELDGLG